MVGVDGLAFSGSFRLRFLDGFGVGFSGVVEVSRT